MNDAPLDRAEPRDDPSADDHGLHCRTCHCRHLFVVYTRARPGGRIVRRRECRHCGTRLTTVERAA